MLDSRQRQDLDNYITGHYGEDQFEKPLTTSAHREFAQKVTVDVYEYDPADDGPECEVITRILAHHPFYSPGQELRNLRFLAGVNRVARKMYGRRYDQLGKKRQARVRRRIVRVS